jgi:hypothetical protein
LGYRPRDPLLINTDAGDFMLTMVAYMGAAAAEVGGCFAFWAWLRMGKSI